MFAAKLKEIRQARGFTQTELARISGISRQNVNYLERGRQSPTLETASKLSDALGVGIGELGVRPQPEPGSPEAEHAARIAQAQAGIMELVRPVPDDVLEAFIFVLKSEQQRRALARELILELERGHQKLRQLDEAIQAGAEERGIDLQAVDDESLELYRQWKAEGQPEGISFADWMEGRENDAQ